MNKNTNIYYNLYIINVLSIKYNIKSWKNIKQKQIKFKCFIIILWYKRWQNSFVEIDYLFYKIHTFNTIIIFK